MKVRKAVLLLQKIFLKGAQAHQRKTPKIPEATLDPLKISGPLRPADAAASAARRTRLTNSASAAAQKTASAPRG